MTGATEDAEKTKKLLQLVISGTVGHQELERFHPSELAIHFHDESDEQLYRLLVKLESSFAARILCEIQEDISSKILAEANLEQLKTWVSTLATDESAHLINQLEEETRTILLKSIEPGSGKDVRDILSYPENQVGHLMQKEVIEVKTDDTIDQAIQQIRTSLQHQKPDNFFKAYVVNHEGVLQGEIPLLNLMMSEPDSIICDVMTPVALKVRPELECEEVANLTLQYNEPSVPVVDEKDHLIGRLTLDDLGEVLVEEFEEDIGMMAGTGEEHAVESFWGSIQERSPWLFLGMIGGLFMAYVLGDFKGNLSAHPEFVFFVPLIASMGGNVGIQSSSIMVRGLATGEILLSDMTSRVLKELRIALVTGGLCALGLILFSVFFIGDLGFGIFISFCLFLIMALAALVGTVTPILLKKFSIEPAYSTGPFITIGNDILGIAIYMNLANLYITWASV